MRCLKHFSHPHRITVKLPLFIYHLEMEFTRMSTSQPPTTTATQQPLYHRFSDVFKAGFSIDWGIGSFLVISHVLVLLLTPVAYAYAPAGLWQVMLAWTLIHAFIGALSTTVYSHRRQKTFDYQRTSSSWRCSFLLCRAACADGRRSMSFITRSIKPANTT